MQPHVGIVIVSYNASFAVRATLASLRQAKNHVPYKLLLIDNDSKPDERDSIRKAFDHHTSSSKLPWKFMTLSRNRGFAGGNNVGIRKFLKDPELTHICLLNSDVIVSDFWLDRLVEKQCDIVSAVTNKADSEQCVPTDYTMELSACLDTSTETVPSVAFETINAFSQSWYKAWQGNVVASEVTFFCVLLTKSLVNRVGLLDTKFFPGGFEDDDYCARVLKSGTEIYLARDVFMHHFGSASFGQLQQGYFSKRAIRNKKYLENKHNFTCKRRPHKPITSFGQDIIYALQGKGEVELQQKYQLLYEEMLGRLIHHYQNEFSAIRNHLVNCGFAIPEELMQMVDDANRFEDIIKVWEDTLSEINRGLSTVPRNVSELTSVEENLTYLSNAVYAKAESNLAMVEFLTANGVFGGGQSLPKKDRLHKAWWFLKKGLPFILRLKGIVFFGGYPYAEREKDGYFQRIRSIDNLFKDRWRIYIDHMPLASQKLWFDRPAPNVLVFHMHNHRYRWFMRLLVSLCVIRCRTIYYHSVLRMEDSKFGTFMKWPGIKKLIDIHGVVPEEFRFHNDFFSAGMYDAHERLALKKADYAMVVTNAMHRYFQHKYREDLRAKVIVLPIFPNISSIKQDKAYVDGKPVVVYAGGTHKWQQVPKMIDAMLATKEFCVHRFFCPNPAEVIEMLPSVLRTHPNITIDSKPFKELLNEYDLCHYGFILREDIIVNHAACPTKLVEYIAMGIIPIVDCEEMGDFKELGMQFIRLRDFVEGKLPDEEQRNRMANMNFEVHNKLQAVNYSGKAQLQSALSLQKTSGLTYKFKSTARTYLPENTVYGGLARKIWQKVKGNNSKYIVTEQPVKDTFPSVTSDNSKVYNTEVPALQPCDVLVQVENFLVGGLENVVLDLNDTLIRSGLKVTLLVLGEAGVAVERAKEKGMTVCITSYNDMMYEHILRQAAPKLVISHYSIHGAALCKRAGIPLLQVIHNTYMWFNAEQAQAFSEAAKHTTAFIAVSDYARTYSLARLGVPKDKCLVIPNGIDISRFTTLDFDKARKDIRTKHGLDEQDFVFLSVGSITHQKNHISTVRAFHKVLQSCPDVKLVILGKLYEQQLWAEIQEYITDHQLDSYVIYAGESNNPPAYYAMADAFVHSAFFEGGQLSLVEALVANLSIVTTEIGFASHLRGRKGVALVPPPVEIIDYFGAIWELTPTVSCERKLAIQMLKAYTDRTRPDFSSEIIELMDKQHTYKLYVDLISELLSEGKFSKETRAISWPDVVSSSEMKAIEPVPC